MSLELSIKDAIQKRAAAEVAIAKILNEFIDDTGITPTSIYFEVAHFTGIDGPPKPVITSLNIECHL